MNQMTVTLDNDQLQALEHLAAARRQSVDTLVRDAIDAYLGENRLDVADWRRKFEQLVTQIQSQIPPSITPEEIEVDITEAREEGRQARRVSRGH